MKVNFKKNFSVKKSFIEPIVSEFRENAEKRIIVTIMSGAKVQQIGRNSIPFMRRLAEAWGCSLQILSTRDIKDYAHPSCGKAELWKFLEDDFRVCYLDLDTLQKAECPNLFDIVPSGKIGLVERGKYWKKGNQCYPPKIMKEYIQKYNQIFPASPLPELKNYSGKYYNAGVFICDKSCFPLERNQVPLIDYKWEWIEQTLFNVLLHVKNIPVHELDWRFNATDGMVGFEGSADFIFNECYIRHYTVNKKMLIKNVKDLRRDNES